MPSVRLLLAAALAVPALLACGGPECPTSGRGALAVTIAGLPAPTHARVTVIGTDYASDPLVATTTISDLAAGYYGLEIEPVAIPGGLVRTAFDGVASSPSACVRDGETVTLEVTYAEIPSSGKLWTTAINGSAHVLGYEEEDLQASSTTLATVRANVSGINRARTITFDRQGNLWVASHDSIRRYPAARLGTSGEPIAPVVIESELLDAGPFGLAFDADGNLWATVPSRDQIVQFSAALLSSGGAIQPSRILQGVEAPVALAFDAAGNLWATEGVGADRVVRFDASGLEDPIPNAPSAPAARISVRATDDTTLANPQGLAFDAVGNLWVMFFNRQVIARLAPAELTPAGDRTVTAGVQLELGVNSLAEGLAFDEAGNLWLAGETDSLLRIDAAQLAASGTVSPAVTLASSDLGSSADWLALYPAPAALPLFHALP